MSQELTWDSLVSKLKHYEDEIKSLRYDLFHVIAERDTLGRENVELKIEMHFMKQRMDDEDFQYVQDCMYNETRKDDFDQRLP